MRSTMVGAVVALLVSGCGGGAGTVLQTGAVKGVVYEVDGQSQDVSGVEVKVLETGDAATTDGAGEFEFSDLPPGKYTLDFEEKPGAPEEDYKEEGHEPLGEDAIEDEEGRPVVEVSEEGGDVEVRVALENGEVKEFSMGDYEERHAVAYLEAEPGVELEGKVRISAEEGQRIKISIYGLSEGEEVDLYIFDKADGRSTPIDTVAADGEGQVCYERHAGEGETLPLGAEKVEDLAGLCVEVRAHSDDELLMSGEVPRLPEEREPEHGEENGKKEEEEEKPHEPEGGNEENNENGDDDEGRRQRRGRRPRGEGRRRRRGRARRR